MQIIGVFFLFTSCYYFSGTITNSGPRRSIPVLVYLRAVLYIPELVWACLGAVWVSDDSKGCDPATVGAVIAAVIARWATQSCDFVVAHYFQSYDGVSISILISSSSQLDYPALYGGGCGVCVRPAGKPPSSAPGRGATGRTRPGKQRGLPVLLHSPLSGCQGVGVQAAAPLLLPAAG